MKIETIPDNLSYFMSPISNTDPYKTLSLHAVYSFISNGALDQLTIDLRAGLKKKNEDLPYITPSGVFSKRSNNDIVSYSGIVCIDLDDINISFKHVLISDPFLNPSLIFVSPSGNGLKLFVRIYLAVAENHYNYWCAIKTYLKDQYNLKADKSCKDVSRACYLCHDPEALFSLYGSVSAMDLLNKYPPEEPYQPSAESFNLLNPGSDLPSAESLNLLNRGSDYSDNPFKDCCLKSLGSAKSHLDTDDPVNVLNRSSVVFQYAQKLLVNHGWRQNDIFFLRPGKNPAHGVSKSDKSAVFAVPPGYSIPVFYNFSSNSPGFLPNKGYSPVQVINILEYNDDFKECINALKNQFSWVLPQNAHLKKKMKPNPSRLVQRNLHFLRSEDLLNSLKMAQKWLTGKKLLERFCTRIPLHYYSPVPTMENPYSLFSLPMLLLQVLTLILIRRWLIIAIQ